MQKKTVICGKELSRRMRFVTWCRKEPDDNTTIAYTFNLIDENGEHLTKYFTSDDTCSFVFMERLRAAWIESIDRVSNEFFDGWNVVLYED